MRIYDGSRPANVETAITSQVMLADLALSATGFAAASNASKAANAISSATVAATGTATWGSLLTSANARVCDFTVGTSGADLNFNTTAFVLNATCSVSAFTVTMAQGT
jgi:hypothetical protein